MNPQEIKDTIESTETEVTAEASESALAGEVAEPAADAAASGPDAAQIGTPEPDMEPEPVSEPEPAVEPEQVAEPETETAPEPEVKAEPEPKKKRPRGRKKKKEVKLTEDSEPLDLSRLKKKELLEIMLAQGKEIDRLRAQVYDLEKQLADHNFQFSQIGSIAEASLAVTKIFEEAEKAAKIYLYNIRRQHEE